MGVSSYIYYLAVQSNLLAAGEFSWSWSSVFSALSEFSASPTLLAEPRLTLVAASRAVVLVRITSIVKTLWSQR
jgi:hypothetical protein